MWMWWVHAPIWISIPTAFAVGLLAIGVLSILLLPFIGD